jgi:5,10-methylenetetrahydromethanopterin reductase
MRSGVEQKTRLTTDVGTILPRPPWGSLAIVSLMKFPELGIYALPGHTDDPTQMYDEAREAEALGLGSCWVGERFDVKDATVCAGAMAAVTSEIIVGVAATNSYTRHPQITATAGATLHRLSRGRFAFGFARGVGIRSQMMGLEIARNAELEDFVGVMRRLWKGERVVGHKGPIGEYPYLHCASWLDDDIPLFIMAFGRKSLAFVGRVFDGVILHTFMSDAAVARAVGLVRKGAEEAGRDPNDVKVYSLVATGCDVDEADELKFLTARMGTYLQAPKYGELLVDINEWDPAHLERFRAAEIVRTMPGGIDQVATLDQLREIRDLIPEEWMPAAMGDAATCARRFVDQFDAGVDGLVVHACTPAQLAPVLPEYEKIRTSQATTPPLSATRC